MYADELYDIITDCKRRCRDITLEEPKLVFTDYGEEIDHLESLIDEYNNLGDEEGKKQKKGRQMVVSIGTAKYPKSAYFLNSAKTISAMPWSVQNATVRKAIELLESLAAETGKKDLGWVKVMAPLMIFGAVAICMVWIVIGGGGV